MNDILKKQQFLQEGYATLNMPDPSSLPGGSTVGDTLDYIKEMSYFMQEEVTELMQEIGGGRQALKPWSSTYIEARMERHHTSERIKSEAIDMLCFAMNICLAAGITPENINHEYGKVLTKNVNRQRTGY